MFRWCSYCQRLLGESPPFDDYALTHGICDGCYVTVDRWSETARDHAIRELFGEFFDVGRRGRQVEVAPLVARARDLGLGRTEILVGLVQPALYRVGAEWQRGQLTVDEEQRFTALCEAVMAALPPSLAPSMEAPGVVLLLAPGSRHDLGLRILAQLASERGLRATLLTEPLPDEELLARVRAARPALVGVSASLASQVREGAALARRCAAAAGCPAVMGGLGFRVGGMPPPEGVELLLTLNEVAARFDELARGVAPARR